MWTAAAGMRRPTALPGAIPLNIEIDVSAMKIATAMHINDVKLPAGITVKGGHNFTIAVVTAPEVEKVAEVVAAAPGAAPAAGAAGAPAAGAAGAPAAAGDKKDAGAAKAPAKK